MVNPVPAEPNDAAAAGSAQLVRLQSEVAEGQLPDPILRVLVSVCNRGSLSFAVTVAQGGLVISGTAVGVAEFMHNMAAELEARGGTDAAVLSEPLRYLGQIADEPSPENGPSTNPVDDLPLYLHLEEATIRSGSAILGEHVRWRGRLAEVEGWSLGTISPEPGSPPA
ncbi:MAG: hypothetical protein JJE46_07675 [Acidimicrobiia bacterium]|nr:hypothetical protein [Acidimicrobiia bacterium]